MKTAPSTLAVGLDYPVGAGEAMTVSRVDADPGWWRGHSPLAVVGIVLIVFASTLPLFAGMLLAPPGLHFTGALASPPDIAQHEAWAFEMAAHLWYENLLTPEPTGRGWFCSLPEVCFGVVQRATGIEYMVLRAGLVLLCAPALAFGLMALARRAGVSRPGVAAAIALLAGSFGGVERAAVTLRMIGGTSGLAEVVGRDAIPTAGGPFGVYFYLLPVVLVLVAVPSYTAADAARGFRAAAVLLSIVAVTYPFFVPTLGLTAVLCALVWAKSRGWWPMLRGIGWLMLWSVLPLTYWFVLPHVDAEYARFAAKNVTGFFSIPVILVNLGLSAGAVVGIPRLLRGNPYQQMLACCTVAFCVALYTPSHPCRVHLFLLSPVLVIAALAAWCPVLMRLRRFTRWILASSLLGAASLGAAYHHKEILECLLDFAPMAYITNGDVAAMQWIGEQQGTEVVLARCDLSPFVASRGHHRVVVGHPLWTAQYKRRRAEVARIFENGADPRSLLEEEHVAWILIDEERGVPAWAAGVKPAVRFDRTVVLRADQLLEHLRTEQQAP